MCRKPVGDGAKRVTILSVISQSAKLVAKRSILARPSSTRVGRSQASRRAWLRDSAHDLRRCGPVRPGQPNGDLAHPYGFGTYTPYADFATRDLIRDSGSMTAG